MLKYLKSRKLPRSNPVFPLHALNTPGTLFSRQPRNQPIDALPLSLNCQCNRSVREILHRSNKRQLLSKSLGMRTKKDTLHPAMENHPAPHALKTHSTPLSREEAPLLNSLHGRGDCENQRHSSPRLNTNTQPAECQSTP